MSQKMLWRLLTDLLVIMETVPAKSLSARGVTVQLLWAIARRLVTHASAIYLLDEFIFLFLVLLKEMRILGECKVLSFLFLVLIKGMGS